MDILSTVLANIKGASKPKNPIDGINLLPFLTDKNKNSPHDFLYWRMFNKNSYAVINKDEKKMVILKDSSFLYDLKKEINEKTNIMDSEKMVSEEINAAKAKWEKGMINPIFLGLGQEEEYRKLKGIIIKK